MYTLHENLGEIIAFPSLLLSGKYMMNIFYKYANELPPFKDYLQLMFNNRRMMAKNRTTWISANHIVPDHLLFLVHGNPPHPHKSNNVEFNHKIDGTYLKPLWHSSSFLSL